MSAPDTAASVYQQRLKEYTSIADKLIARSNTLAFIRLLLFVGFIYAGYKSIVTGETIFIIATISCFLLFILAIRWFDKLQRKTAFYKALQRIQKDEFSFLESGISVYPTGKEYIDTHHSFSHDLDIFGERGLYAYLNRCSSSFGRQSLVNDLLHPDTSVIKERQEAIAELSNQLDFRHNLQGYGSMFETKEKELSDLRAWLSSPSLFSSKALYYFLFLFPIAAISALLVLIITGNDKAMDAFYILFIINLIISFGFGRKISAHLSVSTSVNKLLQQFAGQLKQIEEQSFQSSLLQHLQSRIKSSTGSASASIAKLASLFNYLEAVVNLVVSILLNGLFLFHVHVLYAIENWKRKQGGEVLSWLELLGKIESLNSFANLAHNNPGFCTPIISKEKILQANSMGHILINEQKRVSNNVSFHHQPFAILTGSNMSGKSTFLRTVGINLVLARSGSVVCAKEFVFYPFDLYVSMRITDSLQESESFFYAELKRLQTIINYIKEGHPTFILLDEILRGTNSNDKRNGTIGLIRKLYGLQAWGVIATHDVVVADLIQEYPDYISNICFESEIINDELFFDYTLKQGVATRLNASFLMKKLDII